MNLLRETHGLAKANEFFQSYNKKKSILRPEEKKWFDEAISRYDAAGEVHSDEGKELLADMIHRLGRI